MSCSVVFAHGLRTRPPARAEVSKPCAGFRGPLVHCVRPRRGFVPAADPLSCIDKKGGKEATPADSALAARGLPCAARSLQLTPNSLRGLGPLRSNNRAKLVNEARWRALLQSPALLSSSEGGDEHQIRLASHRRDEHRARGADAKRGVDRESLRSKRLYCSWGPSEPSRSAGLCRGAKRLRPLTSGGCLNAAAAGRVVSSARPAKTEHHRAVGPRLTGEGGRLFFGDFLLAKQKKVTALSGAHPDAASRSEQEIRESSTGLRYLSPNGLSVRKYTNTARMSKKLP